MNVPSIPLIRMPAVKNIMAISSGISIPYLRAIFGMNGENNANASNGRVFKPDHSIVDTKVFTEKRHQRAD